MIYATLNDYDYFVKMMREFKNKKEEEAFDEMEENMVEMQEMDN